MPLYGNKVSVGLAAPCSGIFLNQQGINGCDKRLEIKIPVFWHFNHLNLPVFNHAVSWPSYLELMIHLIRFTNVVTQFYENYNKGLGNCNIRRHG